MKKVRIISLAMFVIGISLLVVWSQGYTAFLTPSIIVVGGGTVFISLSKQNSKEGVHNNV